MQLMDDVVNPASGFKASFNDHIKPSILSNHSGSSRPSYAIQGTVWHKEVGASLIEVYQYDGANDILIAAFNPTTHERLSFGFSATQSSAQSIGTSSFTKMLFTNEELDFNGRYDAPNSKLIAPYPCIVRVNGGVSFTTGGVAIILDVYKNGSASRRLNYNSSGQATYGSAEIQLATNDYLELYVFQSGATQNTQSGANVTYFQATELRRV